MSLSTFKPNPPVDPMAIIGLIQKNKHIKLAGNDKIRIERELPDPKTRAQMVRDVLRSLGTPKVEVVAAVGRFPQNWPSCSYRPTGGTTKQKANQRNQSENFDAGSDGVRCPD